MDDGPGAGGIDEGEPGARAAAEIEQLRLAGAADELHAMLHEALAPVHRLDRLHRVDEVRHGGAGGFLDHVEGRARHSSPALAPQAHAELALEDLLFILAARVAE